MRGLSQPHNPLGPVTTPLRDVHHDDGNIYAPLPRVVPSSPGVCDSSDFGTFSLMDSPEVTMPVRPALSAMAHNRFVAPKALTDEVSALGVAAREAKYPHRDMCDTTSGDEGRKPLKSGAVTRFPTDGGDGYSDASASPDGAAGSGSAEEGFNVMHRMRQLEMQECDREAADLRGGQRGGCCMQLSHTMLRVILLMTREWCSSLCEFVIPIIFVAGTVILWIIFGNASGPGKQYFNASSPATVAGASALLTSTSCYNDAPIGLLAVCDPAKVDSGDYYCPTGRGIPKGFCYPTPSSVTNLGADTASIASDLITYISSTTVSPLPLDTIIMLHWMAMDGSLMDLDRDSLSSLQHGGLLYFAPDTSETASVIASMRGSSTLFDLVYGGTFTTSAEAERHVAESEETDPPNWGIIEVNSFTAKSFDVVIRLNASALPSTDRTLDAFYIGGLNANTGELYLLSGFTTLQKMLYNQYFTEVLGVTDRHPLLAFAPMPTAAYDQKKFLAFGRQLAPLILVLGYLYPVSQLTKRIVLEKELRIREAMLIMGLSEAIIYLAWFLIYLGMYIISSLIMAMIMRFTYLPNTDMGYMFFMLLFFAISTITLSGALATLFSKARLAALLAPIIYFVMAVPLFAMQSASASAMTGAMILSPSALAVGIGLIFEHESGGGVTAKTLTASRDDPSLLIVFVFLAFDVFLYLLLMVYFDLVIPKDWGTTKNPFFCIIDPIKWCCCRDDDDDDGEDGRAADGVFEETNFNEEDAAVRILGLRKKFKRGGKSFLAVNNLYWSLKEGEISVLLGHNGAGKSTTMNLMTGMLEADGGDCTIYGHSVVTNISGARQEIGLCPQHNILWPNLTVREHLDYFAAIKGLNTEDRNNAVDRLLAAVDFEEKKEYMSKALSGGQKRKLSVAIAFVGGSRLIFLDEPTAGMDVGARRHTWGLLKEMAKHHTILLSTHFMDEADLLGNTVAIMSQGRLQCSGSNMFLKSQLGIGFVLTMSVIADVDRPRIEEVVTSFVPNAESMGSGAGEVAYRLPMNSRHDFPSMLAKIEDRMPELGINAYSISATTLEEVFLRIANADHNMDEHGDNIGDDSETVDPASAVWNVEIEESTCTRNWLQFRAMIIKRFWNALRDRRTQFFQIVCPVVCVMLAMLLTLVNFWRSPPLDLSSNIYDDEIEIPVANCNGYLDVRTPFASDATTVVWADVTTGQGFSDKLQATYYDHAKDRYGGLVCNRETSLTETFSTIFYNSSTFHELPVMTANFYNARHRKLFGAGAADMTLTFNPMPKTKREKAITSAIYAVMISIIIMIPFTFMPSAYVAWIVKERECKARHLQNVSGLNFYIYWSANFVFDVAYYIITMFLVIAVFAIFNRQEYMGKEAIGATIVVFLLYGLSAILMAYAVSFLFSDHSTAQNIVMLANFIIGFLLVLAVAALKMSGGVTAGDIGKVLPWIFRIVPSYCVGECISNLATVNMLNAFGEKKTPWDMDIVGWSCMYMAIEIPVFAFIALFVDHPGRRQHSQRLFHNPDAAPEVIEDEDPDVAAERREVLENPERASDLVGVQHMRKQYSNGKVAVRDLTFGVKPGEVFGFLGTNGAGKTTAISILCQEFYPTSGRASICGHDIVTDSQDALRCLGYCPQFDACLDLLTVEEHLYLYAGVRGISSRTRDTVVHGLMKLCDLTQYRKTKSHELSGGNRRKLSVAISLIGGPRVVFLDEPSAGMDPVARRGLWNAIETVSDNCSVVLTTHHLEEVEALVHRVAIMVDGTLRCIGDKTHLKQKYGTGYEVTCRVADETPASIAAVKAFFMATFAGSELAEERSGRLTYQLSKAVKLSEVFARLESAQKQLGISDYNVSQTSIEQVFMRISEEAELEAEAEHYKQLEETSKKRCRCC